MRLEKWADFGWGIPSWTSQSLLRPAEIQGQIDFAQNHDHALPPSEKYHLQITGARRERQPSSVAPIILPVKK